MENLENEFLDLLEKEAMIINGGGVETAAAGAVGGALIGGLSGYKVGQIVTPVAGSYGLGICTGLGIVGGACGGFVEGW